MLGWLRRQALLGVLMIITVSAALAVTSAYLFDERAAAATEAESTSAARDWVDGFPSVSGYDWLPYDASATDDGWPVGDDGGNNLTPAGANAIADGVGTSTSPDSKPSAEVAGESSTVDSGAQVAAETSTRVEIGRMADGSFRYLVNDTPQLFIGVGYNPIYRYLTDEQRAASYDRDFAIMCRAGANHITGWDADKGFEQDKFDELTLDYAAKYGIGVVMPIYLPADGDYTDEALRQAITADSIAKVLRYRSHPALHMWGVGNEVLHDMHPEMDASPFGEFYVQLVDLLHAIDPNHPIIYREAEDAYMWAISHFWGEDGQDRRWLLYGLNSYTPRLAEILDEWPANGLDQPVFVSEFGADAGWLGSRGEGYAEMWRMIRARPDYVLGGAPYAWTIAGPEPTDTLWGLMDASSQPVDDAFDLLAAEWQTEPQANRCN